MFPLLLAALALGLVITSDSGASRDGTTSPGSGLTGFEGDWIGDLMELPDDPPGNGLRSQTATILETRGSNPATAANDVRDLHDLGVSLRTLGYSRAAHRADLRAQAVAAFYHLPPPAVGT